MSLKKNKIGILGGSFDPAHKGHLAISKEAAKRFKLNQIIWAITKKNPFKEKSSTDVLDRIKFCKKIIKKTNCQTYFLNSFIENDEYVIEIEKIELNMNSDKEMSSDLNKIMENSIRKHPSEYLWQHRRFKSTLGKEDFYK